MAATKTTTFIKVTTPPMAIASNDITRDGSAVAGMVEVIPVLFHVSIIYNNIIKKTNNQEPVVFVSVSLQMVN